MILLLTLLASAQPALYSGPDLAEKAQGVVMPIDHVRVFYLAQLARGAFGF